MKKLIALFLALVLVFSLAVPAFALEAEGLSDNPVIMVAGYSSSSLFVENEDGSRRQIWGLDMDAILGTVLSKIAQIGIGLGKLAFGKADYIAKTVGEEVVNFCGDMRCNPDGSSVLKVVNPYNDAEHLNSLWLLENEDGKYRPEAEIVDGIAEIVGQDNIYYLNCDFRMGSEVCAQMLDSFVESVLETTGKEKVNIVSISHGGQTTATYINLFGYKNRIDNAVLLVPAIGGAALAYDVLSSGLEFDEKTLFYFLMNGFVHELDYNWLVEAEQLGFLDTLIEALQPYLFEVLGNWGSIWDFVPVELYEELKAEKLDPIANAEIIASSDRFHYEIYPRMAERFAEARENGANISIIAGYNIHSVTGLDINSDAIIPTSSATGARCADWGKRFADGYTAQGSNCTNPEHYHVSPGFEVDASFAYMPENTWFVDGLFHGMQYKDAYSRELMLTLLLTDEITDIYTNPAFPQFHKSTNASWSVYAEFDSSRPGLLTAADKRLMVTNLSSKYSLKIVSIDVSGADFILSLPSDRYIKPGKSASLNIIGDLPQQSLKNVEITVNFMLVGSATPLGTRIFDFTVMNGEPVEFCEAQQQVRAVNTTAYETLLSDNVQIALDRLGVKSLAEMIFNMLYAIINMLKKLLVMFNFI